MPAVLFGSIGALADTSELQREAFNDAFRAHGLDWNWSRDEYQRLLTESGGANGSPPTPRKPATRSTPPPCTRRSPRTSRRVADAPDRAASRRRRDDRRPARDGMQVALVTTTSGDNVTALAEALRPQIDIDRFALVVDSNSVEHPKPAPDAYQFALKSLDVDAKDCVAVEDNVGGAQAAIAAGVPCVAFPGQNNADHDLTSWLTGSTNSASPACRPSDPAGKCTGSVQPYRGKCDERDPGDLQATDTAFHVEGYEKIEFDLLYVDGAFRPGNPEIADRSATRDAV